MRKLLVVITVLLASCKKEDVTQKGVVANKFEILSYKTTWHPNQSYYANIKYRYTIDTTGVDYFEITSNLRQGQGYSFRHYNPLPTETCDKIDLAACQCETIYYAAIIYRNGTVVYLPEVRL
jgi:hypothetical protein